MTDKICVYFNNNYRAVFDRVDVFIVKDDIGHELIPDKIKDQRTVVNWDNVCFIRPYEEKEESDEP